MTVKRQFSVFEKNVLCLISSFEVIVSTITKKGKSWDMIGKENI